MFSRLFERIAVFLFDNNGIYPLDIFVYSMKFTLLSLWIF